MDTPAENNGDLETEKDFESRIEQFELAWHRNTTPPKIESFIVGLRSEQVESLLHELVLIDIEFRSQRRREKVVYADYIARWPILKERRTESVQRSQRIAASAKTVVSDEATKSSEVGRQIGRYQIVSQLGRGGMGSVFLARDLLLNRNVALKLPTIDPRDLNGIERFYREARLAATLKHPSICQVFDVGQHAGQHFITMEVIDGIVLSAHFRQSEMSQQAIAGLVAKVADAAATAHRAGIIHRDIKPSNIMIRENGDPVIMDFGLAKSTDKDEAHLTLSGALVGTPAYMPPEQIEGKPEAITPASDVYSLGVILYELLTGQLPFRGTLLSVLNQIADMPPRPLCEICPAVDGRLESLCLRMLSKLPADRPSSMEIVATELKLWAHELSNEPLVSVPSVHHNLETSSPKRRAGIVAATAAILILGCLSLSRLLPRSNTTATSRPLAIERSLTETKKRKSPPVAEIPFDEGTARSLQEQWAQYLGLPVVQSHELGMEFRLIPKSSTTEAFYMGTTEVTQLQFESLFHYSPSHWDIVVEGGVPQQTCNAPVEHVFPGQATTFCEMLSRTPEARQKKLVFRLPTNAEWSFACRAGSSYDFSFGPNLNADQAKFDHRAHSSNPYLETPNRVAQYPPNAFGLFDMHGNVSEFCTDPLRLRGGSWSHKLDGLRAEVWYPCSEGSRNERDGFRIVALHYEWPSAQTLLKKLDLSPEIQSDEFSGNELQSERPMTSAEAIAYRDAFARQNELPLEIQNSVGIKFALVPPGLGIQAFYLAETETTQSHYDRVLGDKPSASQLGGANERAVAGMDTSGFPVEQVSPLYANWFCQTLNELPEEVASRRHYRLPTAKEWSHACRAGMRTAYHVGRTITDANAHFRDVSTSDPNKLFLERPVKVASFPPNCWGLFDMHGNVNEICNSAFAESDEYFVCGGHFQNFYPNLRHSRSILFRAEGFNIGVGFRPLLTINASKESVDNQSKVKPLALRANAELWQQLQNAQAELSNLPICIDSVVADPPQDLRQVQRDLSIYLKVPIELSESDGITLQLIPGTQNVDPFYMGTVEVTQAQFLEIMGHRPSQFQKMGSQAYLSIGTDTREHPVESITLAEASEFCTRLNLRKTKSFVSYRLPTCEEWVLACLGNETSPFHSGRTISDSDANFDVSLPSRYRDPNAKAQFIRHTRPVKQHPPNVFGLYDMHGNVAEICSNPSGVRGGSFESSADALVATQHTNFDTAARSHCIGFRIAASIQIQDKPCVMPSDVQLLREQVSQLPRMNAAGEHHPDFAREPLSQQTAADYQRAWAEYLGSEIETINSIGMKLCCIPGSPTTPPLFMSAYEVTQAQFQQVTSSNPSAFRNGGLAAAQVADLNTEKFPVESVTVEDARRFCLKLSNLEAEKAQGYFYRLPTTAEWKLAALAGSDTVFATGTMLTSSQANIFEAGIKRTVAVGSYLPNGWGLYDMHGNVAELCTAPLNIRGGSWEHSTPYVRIAHGTACLPNTSRNSTGFRVVRTQFPKH